MMASAAHTTAVSIDGGMGRLAGWRAQWGGDDSPRGKETKRPPSDNDTLEFVRPKYRILSSACCMPPQIGIHICREPVSPSKPHPSSLHSHTFPCPRVPRSIQTVVFWIRRRPRPRSRRRRLARVPRPSRHTHIHTPHQSLRGGTITCWANIDARTGTHWPEEEVLPWGHSFLLPLHRHLLGTVLCRSTRPCRCSP